MVRWGTPPPPLTCITSRTTETFTSPSPLLTTQTSTPSLLGSICLTGTPSLPKSRTNWRKSRQSQMNKNLHPQQTNPSQPAPNLGWEADTCSDTGILEMIILIRNSNEIYNKEKWLKFSFSLAPLQTFNCQLSFLSLASSGLGKMGQRRNSYSYTDTSCWDIKQRHKLARRLDHASRLRCVQSFSPKSRYQMTAWYHSGRGRSCIGWSDLTWQNSSDRLVAIDNWNLKNSPSWVPVPFCCHSYVNPDRYYSYI